MCNYPVTKIIAAQTHSSVNSATAAKERKQKGKNGYSIEQRLQTKQTLAILRFKSRRHTQQLRCQAAIYRNNSSPLTFGLPDQCQCGGHPER